MYIYTYVGMYISLVPLYIHSHQPSTSTFKHIQVLVPSLGARLLLHGHVRYIVRQTRGAAPLRGGFLAMTIHKMMYPNLGGYIYIICVYIYVCVYNNVYIYVYHFIS